MDNNTPHPILYTASSCPESPRVRAWLTEQDITFTERNVNADLAHAEALYATGIFATPLLVVGDQHVLGYRPDELARVLGIR